MKRFIVLVFAVSLLAAACGSGSETDAQGDTTVPAPPLTTTTTEAPAPATTLPPTTTTTVAATTTTAAPTGIVPGEDPDVDAIVLAYQIAFDSLSDFETKAPYIDDPSGLEETVALYLVTGETMGGDIDLRDVRGEARLETMGGSISLIDAEMEGSIKTMGGSVLFENVVGNIKGSSMGGNVRYKNVRRLDGQLGSPPRTGMDFDEIDMDSVQISTMGDAGSSVTQ